jgi:hypothetical protein
VSLLVVRVDLRHGKREPVAATPPVVRPAEAHAEPATVVVQQARIADGVVDGFVHGNNVPQTHGFDLTIRKFLTDEAGQFGVRLGELALFGLGANLLRAPVVILKEHALENGDFGRHATRRLEVRRMEYLLGVVSDVETALDPVLTGRAVARDREVDDAVPFAPRTGRRRNREFAAQESAHTFFATEFVEDRFDLPERKIAVFHLKPF